MSVRLGELQVALVAAGVEDRLQQLPREAPGRRARLEQVRQVAAGQARTAGQRDARKEGRARGADVGVGGDQLLLGLAHIGPARQHFGGQAHRQLGQAGGRLERRTRRQVGRQRLADQQHERVLVERALSRELREAHPRRLEQ